MYFRSWAATLLLGGCSFLYNANNLPNGTGAEAGIDAVPDAPPDAAPDAEVIRDADGSMLALTGVFPSMGIFEGQGVGNSRPAIVVIEGSQIIPDATVTFTPDSGAPNISPGAAVVSADGDFIAVPIVANLDSNLHDGDTITFSVTVSQSGGTITRPVPGKLTLHGLDQLDGVAPVASALKPLYAEVNLTSDATFTGAGRVEIRSTSSITVLNVIGKAVGATPGPDGCAVASCQGAGGNHAANKDGGGGGAGYGTAGTAGTGNGPGAAGGVYGDPLIASYDGFMSLVANKASGGGNGGVTGTCSAGGSGGAGGGSIELTADGDISIGSINVDGGAGAPGTCSVTIGGAGGGGGGAGGVILIRAGNNLSAAAALSAAGGVGGAGANGGTGGNGGAGRVRFDAATGDAAGNPAAAHRGPAFLATTPLTVNTPSPTLTLNGTMGDAFTVSVTDEGNNEHIDGDILVFGSGQISFTPLLQRGYNTVCIILDGGDRKASEAKKCVNLAMLP